MARLVFISYASTDQEVVGALTDILDAEGVRFFLDKKDINWGQSVKTEVERGLRHCSEVVVVISPASLKSNWVPFEVGQAMASGKKVLPFLVHPSMDMPAYLADLHYLRELGAVREYLRQPLSDDRTFSSEPIFGTFIAFTNQFSRWDVLLESVRCRQSTNDQIEGSIRGVAFLGWKGDVIRKSALSTTEYDFSGILRGNTLSVSYWPVNIAGYETAGSINLERTGPKEFLGLWVGDSGRGLAYAGCRWQLLPESCSLDPTVLVDEALRLLLEDNWDPRRVPEDRASTLLSLSSMEYVFAKRTSV